jgi:hypothetical protein
MDKRKFIRIVGGGAIFTIATSLNGCGAMPDEAVEGWSGPARNETDPRRRALSYALLSPNPHNLQSWLVDLRQPEHVTLYVDKTRLLPMTDPFSRQIIIGYGCFLETMRLAALLDGFRCDMTLFPDGMESIEDGLHAIARVKFEPTAASDELGLASQILHRRSNKGEYDKNIQLSSAEIAALAGVINGFENADFSVLEDKQMVARIADFAIQAFRIEVDTDRTYLESVRKMRVGKDEILAHRDGLSMVGTSYYWFDKLGLMSEESQMKKNGQARNIARQLLDKVIASTNNYGILQTKGNNRLAQIEAGRAYVRINLKSAQMGIAMTPISQILQEYDEMQGMQSRFLSALNVPATNTVQMLFRLGKARPAPATPRRPLDDLLLR